MIDMVKKEKSEKKVVNEQPEIQERLYSLRELANLFNVDIFTMKTMYAIRGIDENTKLSHNEAYEKFNNIV